MIHHCKDDLQKLSFLLKPSLRYSEDFTFIPFRLKPNHEFLKHDLPEHIIITEPVTLEEPDLMEDTELNGSFLD